MRKKRSNLTHHDSRIRRQRIAEFLTNCDDKYRAISLAMEKFNVSDGTVRYAAKEHNVKMPRLKGRPAGISKEMLGAENLLRTTKLSLKDIGEKVGLTRERIRQIQNLMVARGEKIDIRSQTYQVTNRDQLFIDTLKETGSEHQARVKSGVPRYIANRLIQRENLLEHLTEDVRPKMKEKYSTKSMRIIADLMNDSLSLAEIREKHKIAWPRIYNMIAAIKECGIPLPIRADGRASAVGDLAEMLILRTIANFTGGAASATVGQLVREQVVSLLSGKIAPEKLDHISAARLHKSVYLSFHRLSKDGLACRDEINSTRTEVLYTLSEKGKQKLPSITDERVAAVVTEIVAEAAETTKHE